MPEDKNPRGDIRVIAKFIRLYGSLLPSGLYRRLWNFARSARSVLAGFTAGRELEFSPHPAPKAEFCLFTQIIH
jgi:hypothetical protein